MFRRVARNLNVEQKTPDCCFCEQGDDNVDSTLRNFLSKHQLLKKSSLSGLSQVRGVPGPATVDFSFFVSSYQQVIVDAK